MERMEIVSRLVAAHISFHPNNEIPLSDLFTIADQIIIYDRTHPLPLTPAQLEAKHRLCSPACTPEDLCPNCAEKVPH